MMDDSQRQPGGNSPDARVPAQLSAVEAELHQLAQRLADSVALPEPQGACVFEAGQKAGCAQTTKVQCDMLGGTWFAGAACPEHGAATNADGNNGRDPVLDALALRQLALVGTALGTPEPLGTCVYAAGNTARESEMSQLQCELVGGIWFRNGGGTDPAPPR